MQLGFDVKGYTKFIASTVPAFDSDLDARNLRRQFIQAHLWITLAIANNFRLDTAAGKTRCADAFSAYKNKHPSYPSLLDGIAALELESLRSVSTNLDRQFRYEGVSEFIRGRVMNGGDELLPACWREAVMNGTQAAFYDTLLPAEPFITSLAGQILQNLNTAKIHLMTRAEKLSAVLTVYIAAERAIGCLDAAMALLYANEGKSKFACTNAAQSIVWDSVAKAVVWEVLSKSALGKDPFDLLSDAKTAARYTCKYYTLTTETKTIAAIQLLLPKLFEILSEYQRGAPTKLSEYGDRLACPEKCGYSLRRTIMPGSFGLIETEAVNGMALHYYCSDHERTEALALVAPKAHNRTLKNLSLVPYELPIALCAGEIVMKHSGLWQLSIHSVDKSSNVIGRTTAESLDKVVGHVRDQMIEHYWKHAFLSSTMLEVSPVFFIRDRGALYVGCRLQEAPFLCANGLPGASISDSPDILTRGGFAEAGEWALFSLEVTPVANEDVASIAVTSEIASSDELTRANIRRLMQKVKGLSFPLLVKMIEPFGVKMGGHISSSHWKVERELDGIKYGYQTGCAVRNEKERIKPSIVFALLDQLKIGYEEFSSVLDTWTTHG